jgi:hypothetical protein
VESGSFMWFLHVNNIMFVVDWIFTYFSDYMVDFVWVPCLAPLSTSGCVFMLVKNVYFFTFCGLSCCWFVVSILFVGVLWLVLQANGSGWCRIMIWIFYTLVVPLVFLMTVQCASLFLSVMKWSQWLYLVTAIL